jgi:hypothetical protein
VGIKPKELTPIRQLLHNPQLSAYRTRSDERLAQLSWRKGGIYDLYRNGSGEGRPVPAVLLVAAQLRAAVNS